MFFVGLILGILIGVFIRDTDDHFGGGFSGHFRDYESNLWRM